MKITFEITSQWECSNAIRDLKMLMKIYEDEK